MHGKAIEALNICTFWGTIQAQLSKVCPMPLHQPWQLDRCKYIHSCLVSSTLLCYSVVCRNWCPMCGHFCSHPVAIPMAQNFFSEGHSMHSKLHVLCDVGH